MLPTLFLVFIFSLLFRFAYLRLLRPKRLLSTLSSLPSSLLCAALSEKKEFASKGTQGVIVLVVDAGEDVGTRLDSLETKSWIKGWEEAGNAELVVVATEKGERELMGRIAEEYTKIRVNRWIVVDKEWMASVTKERAARELWRDIMAIRWTGSQPGWVIADEELMAMPKFFSIHVWLIFAVFACFVVFASPLVSVFNYHTMKPHATMHPWIKTVAMATNVPIKLGLIHGGLYLGEFFLNRELFKLHVGQRFTTLWYQLLQPHRFGQHLQMHFETLVQVADVLSSETLATVSKTLKNVIRAVLYVVIAGILLQNALTSMGWHSIEEQATGFVLVCIKYFVFDLSKRGAKFNNSIGSTLASGVQWIGASFSLGSGLAWNEFEALHPTAMATLLFVGGALTLLVLLRFKGAGILRSAAADL